MNSDIFKATHHGKLHGIPVYLDMRDPENPGVKVKYNLELILDLAESMFALVCMVRCFFDPNFEPMYPMLVGDPVESEQA